jgi:hypothetical protein
MMVLAGCTPTAAKAGAGATTAPTSAPATTPAAGGHAYRVVDNLCTVVDWTPLRQVYSQLQQPNPATGVAGTGAVRRCTATLSRQGHPLDGVTVQVVGAFWTTPQDAATSFEAGRTMQAGQTTVTRFTGVGTDGFRFANADLGDVVVVYDGNVELSALWKPMPGATLPDLTAAITQVLNAVMAALQES